jgi:hypothetical protein
MKPFHGIPVPATNPCPSGSCGTKHHPLGPGGLQPQHPLGPGGLQPVRPPAPNPTPGPYIPARNPCPFGSCPAQPVAELYNACTFGTAYQCGPAEAAARATSNPIAEAVADMGPQTTCVFPGGVCTSAPLGACIMAGGAVQANGCCPGDKCINRFIPGYMSEGCGSIGSIGGSGASYAAGPISAKMERRAVLDVPGTLDKYTFFTKGCAQLVPGSYATLDGSAVESMGVFDGGAHLQPWFQGQSVDPAHLQPVFPVAPSLRPVFPVDPSLRPVFPVAPSLQPTFQGGSAAVAPVVFPGNTSGGMPFTFPSFNGAGTSIYAPVVIPNNSGTISITNTMSAGGGGLAPAPVKPAGSTGHVVPPGSTGKLVPPAHLVPGSHGQLVPGSHGNFVPGRLVPGSDGRLVPGSHGNFVPGRLVPGSEGRLVPPFTPGPGPVIPLPPLVPPIDTQAPVGPLPLSAIHMANKRGQPTTVSSFVAGAKAGMASTKGPARLKHGQHARLQQSAGTLAVDGLVVLVDASDDAGNPVGGVFHVPVGALANKQPYMVSPSMASGPYGCSLQAVRNGSALHLDMV